MHDVVFTLLLVPIYRIPETEQAMQIVHSCTPGQSWQHARPKYTFATIWMIFKGQCRLAVFDYRLTRRPRRVVTFRGCCAGHVGVEWGGANIRLASGDARADCSSTSSATRALHPFACYVNRFSVTLAYTLHATPTDPHAVTTKFLLRRRIHCATLTDFLLDWDKEWQRRLTRCWDAMYSIINTMYFIFFRGRQKITVSPQRNTASCFQIGPRGTKWLFWNGVQRRKMWEALRIQQ